MHVYIQTSLFQIETGPDKMAYISRAVDEIRRRGLLDSKRVTLAKHYAIERKEENVLGAGGFGAIWKGLDERVNEAVAVKQVHRNIETERFLERELKFLKGCKHQHILQLHGHDIDDSSVYFILELCASGNLDDFVKDKDTDFRTCLNYMRDISAGIRYLHGRHPSIAHRDLKPTNVLVKDNVLKVADFGLSKEISVSFSPLSATPGVGTPGWMAPELCADESTPKDDLSVDIFSLALLFLSLFDHRRGEHLTPHKGMQSVFILSYHAYFRK